MKKLINFIKALFEYRNRMDEGVPPSPMAIIDIMGGIQL